MMSNSFFASTKKLSYMYQYELGLRLVVNNIPSTNYMFMSYFTLIVRHEASIQSQSRVPGYSHNVTSSVTKIFIYS